MSRIGKTPIEIKSGVEISISESFIEVKGPKGSLSQKLPEGINVEKQEEILVVSRANDLREMKALHGLLWSLINNMVVGVTDG